VNETWFRGDNCNFHPSRSALNTPDAIAQYVGYGWFPTAPIIARSDPITTFGSCFARHITEYLNTAGYDVADYRRGKHALVIRCGEGMVHTAAIAQQFRWAYGEAEFNEPLWYDYNGNQVDYEEAIRDDTRTIFDRTNVFILTLGLSEVWYDKKTQEVFWRAIPKSRYDPERHGFKVLSVAENAENLETIYGLIRQKRPQATIICTLSPIPLRATFRPISCITANSVSKASLRVAVDEFMRNHPDDKRLFYFPSYEIVKDVTADPYLDDLHHVRPKVITLIMRVFDQYFLLK
jgi:hypothetical protein